MLDADVLDVGEGGARPRARQRPVQVKLSEKGRSTRPLARHHTQRCQGSRGTTGRGKSAIVPPKSCTTGLPVHHCRDALPPVRAGGRLFPPAAGGSDSPSPTRREGGDNPYGESGGFFGVESPSKCSIMTMARARPYTEQRIPDRPPAPPRSGLLQEADHDAKPNRFISTSRRAAGWRISQTRAMRERRGRNRTAVPGGG